MIPHEQPKHNPQSASYPHWFDQAVAELEEWRPFIEQLPYNIVYGICLESFLRGFKDDIATEGLERALVFHKKKEHRCAGCYRWVKRNDDALTLAIIAGGRFYFGRLCRRCEPKVKRPSMKARIRSYLADEEVGE